MPVAAYAVYVNVSDFVSSSDKAALMAPLNTRRDLNILCVREL